MIALQLGVGRGVLVVWAGDVWRRVGWEVGWGCAGGVGRGLGWEVGWGSGGAERGGFLGGCCAPSAAKT